LLEHSSDAAFKLCTVIIFFIYPCYLPFIHVDHDLWDRYKPQPVEIKTGNIHDFYDIYEELGTWV